MASVKQAWIKKYGEEEGLRKWADQKKKYGRTREQLIHRYGSDYYENLKNKKTTYGLDACIKKYGNDIGKIKWNEIKNKKLETQKQNYNKRLQENPLYKNNNGNTLEYYQHRYGVEDGLKRFEKRQRKHSYMVSKQRYIDEFGKELGTEICYGIKNNSSIKKFIERYGTEEGKIKYEENCRKCGITLERMIAKYGSELGPIKYNKWYRGVIQSCLHRTTVSKISQELFWAIYNNLDEKYQRYCKFHELNEEEKFFFWLNKKSKCYKVDFKCGKYILEFNGVYWHEIRFNKSEYDLERKKNLESIGYYVDIVKDVNYIKNKNLILEQITKKIYETALS